MKRELLIKELKRVREELVTNGCYNNGFDKGSTGDDGFKMIIDILGDTELFNYTETDITLAEFLGWEEDVEYEYECDRFKIEDNELFIYNRFAAEKWLDVYDVSIRFKDLRTAKKVEKRYIVPLPNLKTSDGEQQYLTQKGTFFASRWDKDLRQTWKEKDLVNIPNEYRQYAVEVGEVEK